MMVATAMPNFFQDETVESKLAGYFLREKPKKWRGD
jgi:hypothetical protein